MDGVSTPRLFDRIQLNKINKYLAEKNITNSNKIGGMFDFFNNKQNVLYLFYFIMTILVFLFLYFRHQNKKNK